MAKRIGRVIACVAGFGIGGLFTAAVPGAQEQNFGGLPEGPGREEVFYTCGACHSIRLVEQQRLSRERWDKLLVWMVEEQGMPEPSDDERGLILDYLTEHFGPGDRRPASGAGPLTPRPSAGSP